MIHYFDYDWIPFVFAPHCRILHAEVAQRNVDAFDGASLSVRKLQQPTGRASSLDFIEFSFPSGAFWFVFSLDFLPSFLFDIECLSPLLTSHVFGTKFTE